VMDCISKRRTTF